MADVVKHVAAILSSDSLKASQSTNAKIHRNAISKYGATQNDSILPWARSDSVEAAIRYVSCCNECESCWRCGRGKAPAASRPGIQPCEDLGPRDAGSKSRLAGQLEAD
jgi:hypothetical protein